MLVNLQQGRYMITGIVKEGGELSCYLARDIRGSEYVVNEIKSIELIGKYLPLFSRLFEKGQLNCFTENSCLYFIARHYDGDTLPLYFKNRPTDFRERLRMLEAFTFSLVSFEDMPEIILQSLLKPENISVFRGELQSDCRLWTGCDRKPSELFRDLVTALFSRDEIGKNKLLSIIMQKLFANEYGSFTELYVDIRELAETYKKAPGIILKLKALWDRYKSVVKIVTTVGILVLAAVAIYQLLTGSSAETANARGTPIDHIGTVILGGNSEEQAIHEIQVRESKIEE